MPACKNRAFSLDGQWELRPMLGQRGQAIGVQRPGFNSFNHKNKTPNISQENTPSCIPIAVDGSPPCAHNTATVKAKTTVVMTVGVLRSSCGHDTTDIHTHCSKAIRASQGGEVLAVALPPSHNETRKARHDGEASVPSPDDCLPAHVDEEQTVGLAGGTALETADESDTF
jgi:hypothetical protein